MWSTMNSSPSPGKMDVMNSTNGSYAMSTKAENTSYTSRPNRRSHIPRISFSPISTTRRFGTAFPPWFFSSKMCESEGVASVESTSVGPAAASLRAVAEEQVVLPTPPLPVNMKTSVAPLFCPSRAPARNLPDVVPWGGMELVDTHAHLEGYEDIDALIEAAGAAGLGAVVAGGLDIPSNART